MKYEVFENLQVAEIIDKYPAKIRKKLMELRQLIFDTAMSTDHVGKLEETIKWGQASYLTTESKSGSMIRIDKVRNDDKKYAIYFLCQTSLVEGFKDKFKDLFVYEGNRAIIFEIDAKLPISELKECIATALTYKLQKNDN